MAGELLNISVRGLAERQADLQAVIGRMEDLTPVWDFVHSAWLGEMTQQFATQGSYIDGEEWAPLNPDYARRKLAHFHVPAPYGILYRTGRLMEALSQSAAEAHVYEARPDSALLGATVPYGKYHQTGTEHMPKRRIIGLRNRFKRTIFRAAATYVTGGKLPSVGEGE